MDTEPTDEELRAFISEMLSNVDRLMADPEVIDDAIREHRDMWVLIYRASRGFEVSES